MPTTFVSTATNFTAAQTIAVTDTLYILEGSISVDATGAALAVNFGLSDTFIRMEGGTIINASVNGDGIVASSALTCFLGPDSLVRAGRDAVNTFNNVLDLTNNGTIQGGFFGVVSSGADSKVDNYGSISGGIGVSLGGGGAVLNNFGTISGGTVAIAVGDSAQVLNTGVVVGDVQVDGAASKIVNSGMITGDVDGSSGNAYTFDGRLGRVGGVVRGSPDNDTLTGGVFGDSLFGQDGNDSLRGNEGSDTLAGGSGADGLDGGAGGDTLNGGADADPLLDQDTAAYGSSILGVTVSLADPSINTGDAAGDRFIDIENLLGSALDDVLIGDVSNNHLTGGVGDDRLDGGAGADTLAGGSGNDTYLVDNAADVIIEAAFDIDTVLASVSYTLGAGVKVEIMRANAGATGIALTGNELAQSIFGGSGADTLNGGGGVDTLAGGNGNDTYVVDTTTDTITEAAGVAGGAADLVKFLGTAGQTFALGANVERLTLVGAAASNGTGNGSANLLAGNIAGNVLSGLGGADSLLGGGGNDILIGGIGKDALAGGAGNDLFRFAAADSGVGANADVIADFDDLGNDRIDLSALFGPAMTFRGAQAFSGLGQVRIDDVAGPNVIVEVNRAGDLAADFAIRLTATTLGSMTASDFVL